MKKRKQSDIVLHRLWSVIPYVSLGCSTAVIAKETGFTYEQVKWARKRLKKILK